VCNRDSGIDAIKDFYGTKKTIIIGKPGSGSATTWYGFGVAEKRYQPLSTLDVEGAVATTRLINGKADCMLFVAGLNSVKMQEINALGKGKLKLVKLNDGDLDMPTRTRSTVTIPFLAAPTATCRMARSLLRSRPLWLTLFWSPTMPGLRRTTRVTATFRRLLFV
jgi:hypothetical protein